jgi:phosphoribosylaminoimidazole carboxylase
VAAAAQQFGFPFMLKSKRLAYDGRGNAAVASEDAIEGAVLSLGGFDKGLYAEEWAPFDKELAVMVARSTTGELKSYPLVETIHEDSILSITEAPAAVNSEVEARAIKLAERAVASLDGAGIYGFAFHGCAGAEPMCSLSSVK